MREVVIVAFPGVQSLDVAGPAEVFAQVGEEYRVRVAAVDVAPLPTGSGFAIVPQVALRDIHEPIDTIVVAGGLGTREALADETLIPWLAQAAPHARRVTSVCSGSFLLARAGLLDGHRATTHWQYCDLLAESFPQVAVEPDPIYVRDGRIWTSAGVTAGMDLALALVEDDLGPQAALRIARQLVLYMRRPGGQAQFSSGLAAQSAEHDSLRDLQRWMPGHLDEDLSVPALAARAHMSTRHFSRTFQAETGRTPAVYVEQLRVEHARLLLESTTSPVETVAAQSGFATVETMRRAFARRVGTSPAHYRSRFAAA
jgi:transcriptional regulator GlxA family with amidase domain